MSGDLTYREGMGRYRSEPASGRMWWWRVRGRLVDTKTGDILETRRSSLAEELALLLEQADAGQLEALPSDASPFPAYDTVGGEPWFVVVWNKYTLGGEQIARSRSESLARRCADALNRSHPRKLQRPDSRVRANWF